MATSFEKWQALTRQGPIVQFFRGLFERAGVRVTDTGEEFTCHHKGDHIELHQGLDRAGVDYTVEIDSAQVDRLAGYAGDKELDAQEQYRILGVLFTPATAAMLRAPVLANPWLRWLMGAEDVIHVYLLPPTPREQEVSHTLIYANRQWMVLPGLHGKPGRTYRMPLDEALEYHRQAFAALKANTFGAWWRFASWYKQWRKKVSSRP
jgi:hypothetical protein